MPVWTNQLKIADIFHDDNLSLKTKTDHIVSRIRLANWYRRLRESNYDVEDLLEELDDAGAAGDVEWWDAVWSGLYDVFNAERVWVTTR
jgi:hypothetical protein